MESKPTPLTDSLLTKWNLGRVPPLEVRYLDMCNHARRLESALAGAESALRKIDDKIGHFAKAPANDSMIVVTVIGDVARTARAALAQIEELRNDK